MGLLVSLRDSGRVRRDVELIAVRGEESAWFGGPCYFGFRAFFGKLNGRGPDITSLRRRADIARLHAGK